MPSPHACLLALALVLALGSSIAQVRVTAPGTCRADVDCSDGLHCNGSERCAPGRPGADARGCLAGRQPCASGQRCDEARNTCAAVRIDQDGDGTDSAQTGGNDCDDNDARRFPGNVEICDVDGRDEDCDFTTPGRRDADRDGFDDASCINWGP